MPSGRYRKARQGSVTVLHHDKSRAPSASPPEGGPGAPSDHPPQTAGSPPKAASRRIPSPSRTGVIEALMVLASPALAWVILRLSIMSPVGLPDPSIHTAYIIDPRQIFARYAQALSATARLREGARVGFLVPARISYLLFGAVPGFVVLRYVLALVAVIPSYLLLKRLYSRPAGATAVIVILSSPVVIRALGTDYPNSASVSYLLGATACFGLAIIAGRRRVWWVAIAGALVALSVWAFVTSGVVAAVAVVAYLVAQGVRLRRVRDTFVDVVALLVSALAVTGVLVVLSGVLLGQFNYIGPTWHAYVYFSQPSQEIQWHSRNWHWLTYDTYLLVLPAVVGVGGAAFASRRLRQNLAAVFLVVTTAVTTILAGWLQFGHGVQMLEVHFWSSLLWPACCLTFAVAIAELTRDIQSDLLSRWLTPLAVLAVPLFYEARRDVPAMQWYRRGIAIGIVVVLAAVVARFVAPVFRERLAAVGMLLRVCCVLAMAAGLLAITVAPAVAHPPIPKTINDPPPLYGTTLGVDDSGSIDEYRITAQLPVFTGQPSYPGEELFIWWPINQFSRMIEPMGVYHAGYDSVPGPWGALSPGAVAKLDARRPGQILLMSYTGWEFSSCLSALGPFDPKLVRTGVLRAGPIRLHVWLIDLERFVRQHAGGHGHSS